MDSQDGNGCTTADEGCHAVASGEGGPIRMELQQMSICKTFTVFISCIDTTAKTHRYIGSTQDLSARLTKHNVGEVPHTSEFSPWRK